MILAHKNILTVTLSALILGSLFYWLITPLIPVEEPRLTDKQIAAATPCQQTHFRIWTTEDKLLYASDLEFAAKLCHQQELLVK
jgi:hypothetical protein